MNSALCIKHNHGHRDQPKLRRRKGPSQLLRDRARAADHRETLNNNISNDDNPANEAEVQATAPVDLPQPTPPPAPPLCVRGSLPVAPADSQVPPSFPPAQAAAA